MTDNPVRARWQAHLAASMPPVEAILPRNRAITAQYARWYLAHPHLCKWAGMAAYASDQIRTFLTLGARTAGWAMPDRLRASFSRIEEEIRRTNNAIFDDIGWAHAAYLAPEGGLPAVEAGLADALGSHGELLEAFRRMDEARRAAAAGRPSEGLAWDAGGRMLKHEQHTIAQAQFDTFPRGLRVWMSLTSSGQFGPARRRADPRGWFWLHGVRRGHLLLDLARLDTRWAWLEAEVLPLWAALDQGPTGVWWTFLEQCAAAGSSPDATSPAPRAGA